MSMVDQTISHYKVTAKLGEGGMGVVYKAEDAKLKRSVALKFLAAHLLANDEEKERFTREAQAAAALDHPNICTVHEIDEADGRIFIAMCAWKWWVPCSLAAPRSGSTMKRPWS